MKKKTVLVTGFGPFPGVADNPSAVLVRGLRAGDVFNLHARVLPVTFADAGAVLQRALAETRPAIVICFGVAANRDRICWERAAWNMVDPHKPDAAGHYHRGTVVRADGPEGYGSTLPLPDIAAALVRGGFPATPSNNAGDYLCNYIFYQLMHHAAQQDNPPIGGFIHIPLPRVGTRLDVAGLRAAGQAIVEASVAAHQAVHPRVIGNRALWAGARRPSP